VETTTGKCGMTEPTWAFSPFSSQRTQQVHSCAVPAIMRGLFSFFSDETNVNDIANARVAISNQDYYLAKRYATMKDKPCLRTARH
jgi:hypothetical protein